MHWFCASCPVRLDSTGCIEASKIQSCTDSPVFRFSLFAVAITITDSVWCIRYIVVSVPKEDCQRSKEREHANFEQGLYGGWVDHGGDWVKAEKEGRRSIPP